MAGKSVYITRAIPEIGIAKLTQSGLEVAVHPLASPPGPDELRERASRHDAVICQLSDRIDAKVLRSAAGRCRIFATCAVGTDNIDVGEAKKLGIVVSNTPDVLTDAVADLTWALLLATARRLGEAEKLVRCGGWRGWSMLDYLGADVFGRTIGMVGAGRIGTAVARRATGFGMKILYHARSGKPEIEALGARRVPLVELMSQSDFVSLHVPLTEETRNLIDERMIMRMQRHAIFINTARGEVVEQAALIEALRDGRIAAAGLDVYQNEPRVPKELLDMANVVLLPHIGSATVTARSRMASIAADNVIAVLHGEKAITPVWT